VIGSAVVFPWGGESKIGTVVKREIVNGEARLSIEAEGMTYVVMEDRLLLIPSPPDFTTGAMAEEG